MEGAAKKPIPFHRAGNQHVMGCTSTMLYELSACSIPYSVSVWNPYNSKQCELRRSGVMQGIIASRLQPVQAKAYEFPLYSGGASW